MFVMVCYVSKRDVNVNDVKRSKPHLGEEGFFFSPPMLTHVDVLNVPSYNTDILKNGLYMM